MTTGLTIVWGAAFFLFLFGAMILNAGSHPVASLEDSLGPAVDVWPL